jgi:hypothetical protein
VVTGLLITLTQASRTSLVTSERSAHLERELRKARTWIMQELPASASTQVTVDPVQGRLTFRVPLSGDWNNDGVTDEVNPAGQIVWGAEGQALWWLEYGRGGPADTQLVRRVRDAGGNLRGDPTVLANDVRAFTVDGLPNTVQPTTIILDLTVERNALQRQVRTHVRLRNSTN